MRYVSSIAVVVCLWCAVPAISLGGTVYVDKYSPGPTHDGKSWATAALTIPAAIMAASPGDEVWVGLGTYTEAVTLKQGVSVYGGFIGYEIFRDQRLGIQGLTTVSPVSSASAVIANAGITTATVLDGFAFQCSAYTGNLAVIYCNTGSPTISHNTITGLRLQRTSAINCNHSQPVITNNVIANNAVAPGEGSNCGAIFLTNANPAIVNNTIVGNSNYAIAGGGTSFVIANNIIAFNYASVQLKATQTTAPPIRNNCIYGNVLPATYFSVLDPTGRDGNITVDPKFAVYAYGNLHLAADSPCRNVGDDVYVAAGDTDIDFQPRIQGSHVDIGADESDGRTWTFTPRIVRVSPSGDDANDGSSWALAKKSIQAGIDLAAVSGGEIWVQSGTYASLSSILLRPYCYLYGGFAGTETTLAQRDWAANPTFLSPSRDPLLNCLPAYRASAVDGFVLSGGTLSALVASGSSPFVRNNLFVRNAAQCVTCSGGNPLITNNGFFNNAAGVTGGKPGGAVTCSIGQAVVTGNVFSANNSSSPNIAAPAVYFSEQAGGIATNNLFEGNGAANSTLAYASSCVGVNGGSVLMANNTFVNNRGTALAANSLSTIANNVFAFNDAAVYNSTDFAPGRLRANCFYGNTKDYPTGKPTGAYGSIQAYPGFADLLRGDYRLLSTSPCVDAGDDSLVAPGEVDLDGLPRIRGRHVDIGCYESDAIGMTAHWGDIARAMRIAGGLMAATPEDVLLLDRVAPEGPHTLDLLDAQSLLRHFATQPQ